MFSYKKKACDFSQAFLKFVLFYLSAMVKL